MSREKTDNRLCPGKIDLHIHSTFSDGTDTPEQILEHAREIGLDLFSITDHDALKAGPVIRSLRKEGDPAFVTGVEFSCKDEKGKYHILGYGYDPEAEAVQSLVEKSHSYRLEKVHARLDFLRDEYGFDFPEKEIKGLFALENPGKPHLGNLMARYGYAGSKDEAISNYINKCKFRSRYLTPREAIEGILACGGIPILAHPPYGNGSQMIVGEELEQRVKRLIGYGLQGLEGFYSRYPAELRSEILALAQKYHTELPYITAGSDYHGSNKRVRLADTGCPDAAMGPGGLQDFLKNVLQ